jgi:hypothetical protein
MKLEDYEKRAVKNLKLGVHSLLEFGSCTNICLPSLREILRNPESGGSNYFRNLLICLLNYKASFDISILASGAKV